MSRGMGGAEWGWLSFQLFAKLLHICARFGADYRLALRSCPHRALVVKGNRGGCEPVLVSTGYQRFHRKMNDWHSSYPTNRRLPSHWFVLPHHKIYFPFFVIFNPTPPPANPSRNHSTTVVRQLFSAATARRRIDCSWGEALSSEVISQMVSTAYEARSQADHRALSHLIAASLPHCSPEMARKLSFFLEELPPDQHPAPHTLLLRPHQGSDRFQSLQAPHHPSLHSAIASLTLSLSPSAVQKSELMAGSVEEEIKVLQASDYFSEVPKRRLFAVIKQAEVSVLSYGERLPRQEGRSRQDVFFARRGEFCYEARHAGEEKSIEIFTFREGHLFSQASFSDPLEEEEASERGQGRGGQHEGLSVRCKSSRGVLYRFSREFFSSHLLHYCEGVLSANTDRLNDLLRQRVDKMAQLRKPNSKFLAQKIPRSLSMELQTLRDSRAACARKGPAPKEPEPVLDISEKSHDYQTLKNSLPLRDKLYSKAELARLSFNPQKNESDLLLWKKSKCFRLRELSKSSRPVLSKAETMMEFIKFTVQFEKTRRKPSLL